MKKRLENIATSRETLPHPLRAELLQEARGGISRPGNVEPPPPDPGH